MIKFLIKLSLAFAIIYYLVNQGLLEFNNISQVLEKPLMLIASILVLIICTVITAYRWKILLDIKSNTPIPLKDVLSVTWIGLLFSTVLPGAITGDLIRLLYARKFSKNLDKSYLFTSLIFDRVFGLVNLLLISGLFSLINYTYLSSLSEKVTSYVHFNFLLFGISLAFLSSLFWPKKVQQFILNITDRLPIVGRQISNLLKQIWLIGQNKSAVFLSFSVGLPIPILVIMAFWGLTEPFYSTAISLQDSFTFLPLGLVSTAIPLAPAGMGVGHAAFAMIYGILGDPKGASYFNLLFLLSVFNNLIGIIPYLFTKNEREELKKMKDN